MKDQEELFKILREVQKNPNVSQRALAINVNFSLGKLNYCLQALKKKGLIKIKNFSKNRNRFNPKSKNNYFYMLTAKGISKKTSMAINFLKRKMVEYNEIKREIESYKNKRIK